MASVVSDDAKRAMESVATITDSLSEGRGTLGRLMTDDALFRRSEQSLRTLQDDLAALAPVVARLDDAAIDRQPPDLDDPGPRVHGGVIAEELAKSHDLSAGTKRSQESKRARARAVDRLTALSWMPQE